MKKLSLWIAAPLLFAVAACEERREVGMVAEERERAAEVASPGAAPTGARATADALESDIGPAEIAGRNEPGAGGAVEEDAAAVGAAGAGQEQAAPQQAAPQQAGGTEQQAGQQQAGQQQAGQGGQDTIRGRMLAEQVRAGLTQVPAFGESARDVQVTFEQGRLVLRGQVQDERTMDAIVAHVQRQAGGYPVENQMDLAP